MNAPSPLSHRERELAAIITAYNEVTEQLKKSHEVLGFEVRKLRVEIEEKNQELMRSERLAALGQMATGVAHEIRNPLGSIQLYASLLDRDLRALPQSQNLVRKIAAGVDALDRVVGEILDFAGRQEVQPQRVALATLAANVCDAAAGRAQAQQVRLCTDASLSEHQVCVDRARMERALLNIVLNGIDAIGQQGVITLSAEQQADGMVVIQIEDDGPGVDPAIIGRVFNPFFTTKDHGTGLGLPIAHRIVESHGGRISVADRQEGGACFKVYVPGAPAP